MFDEIKKADALWAELHESMGRRGLATAEYQRSYLIKMVKALSSLRSSHDGSVICPPGMYTGSVGCHLNRYPDKPYGCSACRESWADNQARRDLKRVTFWNDQQTGESLRRRV